MLPRYVGDYVYYTWQQGDLAELSKYVVGGEHIPEKVRFGDLL